LIDLLNEYRRRHASLKIENGFLPYKPERGLSLLFPDFKGVIDAAHGFDDGCVIEARQAFLNGLKQLCGALRIGRHDRAPAPCSDQQPVLGPYWKSILIDDADLS
jgi:hypothetical protein